MKKYIGSFNRAIIAAFFSFAALAVSVFAQTQFIKKAEAEYCMMCGCKYIFYVKHFEPPEPITGVGGDFAPHATRDAGYGGSAGSNAILTPAGGVYSELEIPSDMINRPSVKGKVVRLTGFYKVTKGRYFEIAGQYKVNSEASPRTTQCVRPIGLPFWKQFDLYFDFTDINSATDNLSNVKLLVKSPDASTPVLIDEVRLCSFSDGTLQATGPLLKSLSTSTGTWMSKFNPTVLNYTLKVPQTVTHISFSPTVVGTPQPVIKIKGNVVATGGEFVVDIGNVESVAGVDINVSTSISEQTNYFVNIEREEPAVDATLYGLDFSIGTLNPAFYRYLQNYSNFVPTGTHYLKVVPTAFDPTSIISVNGQTVATGTESPSIDISTNKTITIVVTAKDGTTQKTYTVNVTEAFFVEFPNTTGAGSESEEWVQIPVAISSLHAIDDLPVTVDYTVTGVNGAVAGTDFVLANGQLTWGYCSGGCGTAQNISLQILGDSDYDPGEGVEITLSNPVNAILGDKKTFTYTINDAPPILFTSPTGGQYHVGETVQIQWRTLDPTISSVNLELSMDNGMSWELLKCDASMQNTDSDWENYSWTIPATSCGGSALGGSTILVKVSSAMQPDIFSKSGPMSILPPALVITTPTSGSFRIGETMQIQWQTNDLAIEAVNLLVSRDNGMSWELINCGASISRTDPQWQNYAWIIPTQTCEGNGLQASNILLMVASSEQPNVNAKAGPFTILENIPPTIHITVPTDQPRLTYSLPIHRIAGEAWDNVGVTSVTYTLSGHTIDDGLAEGLENWSVDNLNIGPGTTTVTVTAHDAAGNSAVDILVIDIGYD